MRVVIGIVLGLLVGLVVGRSLVDPSGARTSPRTETDGASPAPRAPPTRPELREPAQVQVEPSPARMGTPQPPVDSVPSPGAPPEREDLADALIGERLREYGRAEIARGWVQARRDELPERLATTGLATFEREVRELPFQIGRSLGDERTRDEHIAATLNGDDPLGTLEAMQEQDSGPQNELVTDAARFERFFPRRTGARVDGPANLGAPDEALTDGSVLTFPTGVFRLRALMKRDSAFPRDVTVRGMGMDATMLVVGDLSTHAELVNMAFEDCTVFTDNDSLFDLRRAPASVRLERVRVIGFDSGAGGSSLLDAPGLALLARNSRIEGGYGRHPDGTLFDVRTKPVLARFENCWIDEVNLGLEHLPRGSSVAFVSCRLTNVLDRRLVDAHPNAGVVLIDSPLQDWPADAGDPPKKDLESLFPGWRERLIQ